MAIELSKLDRYGVTHDNAYTMIAESNVNWLDKVARITFNVYHDHQTRLDAKDKGWLPLDQLAFNFDANSSSSFNDVFSEEQSKSLNTQEVCYKFIKALPEFINAKDILDVEPAPVVTPEPAPEPTP